MRDLLRKPLRWTSDADLGKPHATHPPAGVALTMYSRRQATALLAASGSFSRVLGTDPSKGMIEAARSTLEKQPSALLESGNTQKLAPIEYQTGSAEDLSSIEAESIDLVTAGQAAHWFNHDTVYNQLLRILKPGGTVAYWGYSYLFLPDYPAESKQVAEFGLKTLAGYWEPGRKGPESLYDLVPFPKTEEWDHDSFEMHKFDQTESSAYQLSKDRPAPPSTRHFPITMRKTMNVNGLRNQMKTWSSVHTYMEKHQPSTNKADDFVDTIAGGLPAKDGFAVEWPLGLLLMKKKR